MITTDCLKVAGMVTWQVRVVIAPRIFGEARSMSSLPCQGHLQTGSSMALLLMGNHVAGPSRQPTEDTCRCGLNPLARWARVSRTAASSESGSCLIRRLPMDAVPKLLAL